MNEGSEIPVPTRPNLTVVGAGCMALAGFAVSLFAGLVSNNPFDTVLLRGMFALVVCFPLGCGIGYAMERIIADHARHIGEKVADSQTHVHRSSTETQHNPNNEVEREAA